MPFKGFTPRGVTTGLDPVVQERQPLEFVVLDTRVKRGYDADEVSRIESAKLSGA